MATTWTVPALRMICVAVALLAPFGQAVAKGSVENGLSCPTVAISTSSEWSQEVQKPRIEQAPINSEAFRPISALSHFMVSKRLAAEVPGFAARVKLFKQLGLSADEMQGDLARAIRACAARDAYGWNYSSEVKKFANAFHASASPASQSAIDDYLTRATLAALEHQRLETVLREGARRTDEDGAMLPEARAGVNAALVRLLALRERFPFLQNSSLQPNAGSDVAGAAFAQMVVARISPADALEQSFYGSDEFDRLLGLDGLPKGAVEAIASLSPFVRDQRRESIYAKLYRALATKRIDPPDEIKRRIRSAIAETILASMQSVTEKCMAGPCGGPLMDPLEFSHLVALKKNSGRIRSYACACGMGEIPPTIPDRVNEVVAGLGGALALACVLNPETAWLCRMASASLALDIGAGVAGIYDAEVNRAKLVSADRLSAEVALAKKNYAVHIAENKFLVYYAYNWLTGLFSFAPYQARGEGGYRLSEAFSALFRDRAVLKTEALETAKFLTAFPPPDMPNEDQLLSVIQSPDPSD